MNYGLINAEPVIRTVSGKWVNVFDPKPEMFCIEDIAHALSHQCRFGGHMEQFYSVAQHSYLCAMLIAPEHKFAMLMHDASEAYLLDIPRPIKKHLSNYKEIEDKLMTVIASVFGFEYPLHEEVHIIDNKMLDIEWMGLIIKSHPVVGIERTNAEEARQRFLNAYHELKPTL